jgi:queuine tRNA-ribosyltransferase
MGAPLTFEIRATDGDARMGRLITPHGEIATPCFMPVGTRAAVKAMAPDELWGMGYRLVLANAYHLAVRPGPELVHQMGGIARFMGFRGAILTDSGGFQAMSLAKINSINEGGIRFRSHLDGALVVLTPESAVEIQQTLGTDIMMALDECTPFPADRSRALASRRARAPRRRYSASSRAAPMPICAG